MERVRDDLAMKNRFVGYLTGSVFGAITPFCSCSSIPVFLGFTSAGIPVGITMSFRERHDFAKNELWDIFSRVWKWVFIGVGLGAALHGYVPVSWLAGNLGYGQWWSVPLAVLLGIPLYSNATGLIPIMESLIIKGLPIGTTMAFCMSTVAASFPEFILLKQVMTWKLLAIILAMLLFSFTLVGWILNLVN